MTLVITHSKVSTKPVGTDSSRIYSDSWNANHTLTGVSDASQLNGNVVQSVTNDTNIQGSISAQNLTFSWAGTLAASRLNGNVVQAVTNDTNITGSVATQTITLGWTGTLAAARLNSNVVQAVTNDTNVTGTVSAQNLTFGWTGTLGVARGGLGASLSATGGASQFLKQSSVGAAVTVAQPAFTDISGQATLAQLPTLGANTVLGSIAGGTPIALTTTQHTSLVNTFTTSLSGAVAAPGTVTGKVLSDNGTWIAAGGTGTVTSVAGGNQTITTTGTIQTDSGLGIQNLSLSASVASNILTVNVLDSSGATCSATSSARIQFRSSTATSGVVTSNYITGALSVSTFATGATLGSSNATAFRFWVCAFDNAGTTVLALINCSNGTTIFPLNETTVASTVAMTSGATSAGVFYTPNGTTLTSKAFRILGYVEYNSTGLVTAGTYATAPNFIQLMGAGVSRPGSAVQQSPLVIQTTNTNNATSTYAATTTSTSITLTSAANLVRGSVSGSMQQIAAANSRGFTTVFRGGAAFTNSPVITMFAGQFVAGPVSAIFFDKPNSVSSQTYAVYIRGDGTSSVNFPDNVATANGIIFLEEIMG